MSASSAGKRGACPSRNWRISSQITGSSFSLRMVNRSCASPPGKRAAGVPSQTISTCFSALCPHRRESRQKKQKTASAALSAVMWKKAPATDSAPRHRMAPGLTKLLERVPINSSPSMEKLLRFGRHLHCGGDLSQDRSGRQAGEAGFPGQNQPVRQDRLEQRLHIVRHHIAAVLHGRPDLGGTVKSP